MKSTGYCVVQAVGNRLKLFEVGCIPTKPTQTHGERLHVIHEQILLLERVYQPLNKTIVRERGFSKFNKATQALYKVHGTIEEALYCYDIVEYSPQAVKRVLTGNAKAFKQSVADAVQGWLEVPSTFTTDDESDAVAVAITHLIEVGLLTKEGIKT